ncbi:hypothetical protein K7432_008764 [Basidiobolus ranarum]|uniref:B30.2/SPRY domain-containing protein n=1 Tax=Basidiobolus ranarum TaxID=34480 RepID=A0ABR2VY53_9FUNG
MTQKIIQSSCTNQLMLHILNGDRGKIQRTCAKTLVILANHETSFFQRIFTMIVEPLIEHIIDLGEETILSLETDFYPDNINREFFISNELRTDRPLQLRRITSNDMKATDEFDFRMILPSALLAERFISFIRTLHIFVEYDRAFEDFVSQNQDPQTGELLEGELTKLLRILVDMTSLPLVNSKMSKLDGDQYSVTYKPWDVDGDSRSNLSCMVRDFYQSTGPEAIASSPDAHQISPNSDGAFGLSFDSCYEDEKDTSEMEIDTKNTKISLCNYSLNVLVALSKYGIIRRYLMDHDFLKTALLVQQLCRPALENSVIAISIMLSKSHIQKCLESPEILINAWRGLFKPLTQTSTILFYTQMLLSHCSNYSLGACESVSRTRYLGLSRADRTKHLIILKDNLEVRNELWTFGSVRAARGVQGNGRYAYEVRLNTDGLVQLGWASKLCRFDPEGGSGVGDDIHSYSYDGQRSKKWHGICPVNNQYGDKWCIGDIITSCLDLDNGIIEYYKNGVYLGIAFKNVSTDTIWYPALSLASGQGCKTYFGGRLDPLKYLPKAYEPVALILEFSKIGIHITTEGKSDISVNSSLGSLGIASGRSKTAPVDTKSSPSDTTPSDLGQVMFSSTPCFTEEPDFMSVSEETSPSILSHAALSSTPVESEECSPSHEGLEDIYNVGRENQFESINGTRHNMKSGSMEHQKITNEQDFMIERWGSDPAEAFYHSLKNGEEHEDGDEDDEDYMFDILEPQSTLDSHSEGVPELMFPDSDLDLPFSRMLRLRGISPNIDLPEPNFIDAFYYEILLGLKGLIDGLYPQIGMIDRDNTIYMLIVGDNECFTAIIKHAYLDETFFRNTLPSNVESYTEKEPNLHSDILSLEKLEITSPIVHGDCVGCGYSKEEKSIFFTSNGNLLARIPVSSKTLLLPYIRHIPRLISNFGQEKFKYQPAYSIVSQMLDV